MTSLFEIDSLSHRYGSVLALDGVSLSVEQGAIGLVGQNGAGKSTLIKILLGLVRHTDGTVRVFGSDVAKHGVGLRGRIGYMPERGGVTPGLNGIEYVGLSGELNGMPRKLALRRAHELLSRLGLEEARYRRLENYSAGMVQRIKLAATLVHDPDLLLLDEPTSGLDPDGRTAMLAMLKSLAQRPGKSLLFSTHLLGDIDMFAGTRSSWRRAGSLPRGRSMRCSPGRSMPFASLEKWKRIRQRCVSRRPAAGRCGGVARGGAWPGAGGGLRRLVEPTVFPLGQADGGNAHRA